MYESIMGFFRPILSEIFPEGRRKRALGTPLIMNKTFTRDSVINKASLAYMEKTVAKIDAVIANKTLQEHNAKTPRVFKTRPIELIPLLYFSTGGLSLFDPRK